MFIDDNGYPWNYQPALRDLRAKNTLFISLADYTDRAFERTFERAFAPDQLSGMQIAIH